MNEEIKQKQKLEKRFEKWLRKYLLCNNCKKKCTCIQLNAYCEEQVKQAYIAGATEETKELQNGNFVLTVNEIIEGKDKKIAELEKENAELKLKLEALEGQTPWKDIKDKSEVIGKLTNAKKIISEWEDSFCCGADYLYLGNKGKELRIKSQKFLNSKAEK